MLIHENNNLYCMCALKCSLSKTVDFKGRVVKVFQKSVISDHEKQTSTSNFNVKPASFIDQTSWLNFPMINLKTCLYFHAISSDVHWKYVKDQTKIGCETWKYFGRLVLKYTLFQSIWVLQLKLHNHVYVLRELQKMQWLAPRSHLMSNVESIFKQS